VEQKHYSVIKKEKIGGFNNMSEQKKVYVCLAKTADNNIHSILGIRDEEDKARKLIENSFYRYNDMYEWDGFDYILKDVNMTGATGQIQVWQVF
jgi:hypothetical protein